MRITTSRQAKLALFAAVLAHWDEDVMDSPNDAPCGCEDAPCCGC